MEYLKLIHLVTIGSKLMWVVISNISIGQRYGFHFYFMFNNNQNGLIRKMFSNSYLLRRIINSFPWIKKCTIMIVHFYFLDILRCFTWLFSVAEFRFKFTGYQLVLKRYWIKYYKIYMELYIFTLYIFKVVYSSG